MSTRYEVLGNKYEVLDTFYLVLVYSVLDTVYLVLKKKSPPKPKGTFEIYMSEELSQSRIQRDDSF